MAILPATAALFDGALKVTMEQAMLRMSGGTMIVVERDNGYGKTPTRMLLSSAGRMSMTIGHTYGAHHDQTLRPYGQLRVLDVIHYAVKNGEDHKQQVVLDEALVAPLTLNSKFPLFVFK